MILKDDDIVKRIPCIERLCLHFGTSLSVLDIGDLLIHPETFLALSKLECLESARLSASDIPNLPSSFSQPLLFPKLNQLEKFVIKCLDGLQCPGQGSSRTIAC
ncbi:hypothetical protein CC2G_008574 [Coprinopsis cinerea AmutBmut pab1-1]|nr:hypothetical protein CC2G_008574 [Coprinopsis cinerea AmutBmut pab1-1]